MQKKNKNTKETNPSQKDSDPFLRRIQLQDTILKKLLAEVDPNSSIEYEDISIDEDDMPIEEKQ